MSASFRMATEKVVIIGSGPSGYTAAIYAARAQLSPVLYEGREAGGQLMWTSEVENFPGFPDGIQGPELMQLFRKQAERFGTRFVSEHVSAVDIGSRPFTVTGENGTVVAAETIIISTGASAIWLNVPGEETYKAKGVSACATCDGFFFRGKNVAVVGGGDSAMEEATFLTRFASHVTVLVRGPELRASKIMQEKAKKDPKITIIYNVAVAEVMGDGQRLKEIRLKFSDTGKEEVRLFDGLFMAIGHAPNTKLFQGKIDLDVKGYVVCKPGSTATSVPGIFAAGDVMDHKYRQAITAAGTGCMAAIDVEKYLSH